MELSKSEFRNAYSQMRAHSSAEKKAGCRLRYPECYESGAGKLASYCLYLRDRPAPGSRKLDTHEGREFYRLMAVMFPGRA